MRWPRRKPKACPECENLRAELDEWRGQSTKFTRRADGTLDVTFYASTQEEANAALNGAFFVSQLPVPATTGQRVTAAELAGEGHHEYCIKRSAPRSACDCGADDDAAPIDLDALWVAERRRAATKMGQGL